MLVLGERGTPKNLEKNLSEQNREPTNLSHIWRPVLNRTRLPLVKCECTHHWANPSPTTRTNATPIRPWQPVPNTAPTFANPAPTTCNTHTTEPTLLYKPGRIQLRPWRYVWTPCFHSSRALLISSTDVLCTRQLRIILPTILLVPYLNYPFVPLFVVRATQPDLCFQCFVLTVF